MELLEAIIQNEHIVEYVCVTVFTLVGLATYTYLVYRNSIKDVKPDTEVDDDLESNIGSIYVDSDEVIDKGKGKMVDRGEIEKDGVVCYKCKKIGHFRIECPKLRENLKMKKKALVATWSDSEESSSEDEY